MNTNDAPVALLTKLHAVAEAVDYFEKRGYNKHQSYNYVQAVDVVGKMREALLSRKVIVLPGASSAQHLPYAGNSNKAAFLTTVDLSYTFYDIETGQSLNVPWVGVGVDTGGDKGIYKAFTGGLKYMLTTTFLVPSSDDPERDQLTQREDQEADNVLNAQGGPATPAPSGQHKDDVRPPAPKIPRDRALTILQRAKNIGMATFDMEAASGTAPEFHPVFSAALALQQVTRIGDLNVDQAEGFEAWLANEEKQVAGEGA